MGCVEGVGYDVFPAQGPHLGKRVKVCFNYDTSHTLLGNIVRDDSTGKNYDRTIIRLDDGRYVLSTECQYSLIYPL